MKLIIVTFIALIISGCGGGESSIGDNKAPLEKTEATSAPTNNIPIKKNDTNIVTQKDNVYIVSGQSNASLCDWSYFESISGHKVINIARAGHDIGELIGAYNNSSIIGVNPKGIIFIHGESDAIDKTELTEYSRQVEEYRALISNDVDSDLPMYISTVGYYSKMPDDNFNALRSSVANQAELNPLWFIAYDDAKNFRDWGMISDGIHFTVEGCQVMMEGIYSYL